MLAGSIFAMGLPCLSYILTADIRMMPNHMLSILNQCNWWGGSFCIAGLAVLALSLLMRTDNPYGYFAFGVMLSGTGLILDLVFVHLSIVFFFLLLAFYLLVLLFPNRSLKASNFGHQHNSRTPKTRTAL